VGACATGTHGSGIHNGNLSTAVAAVEFINGNGETVTLSRASDPEQFSAAVIGLGALGIITSITLEVLPSFKIAQIVYENLSFDQLEHNLDAIFSSGYSVSLFTDWADRRVIDKIWVKSRGAEAPDAGGWGARPAEAPQHPITGQDPAAATQQLGQPGPWAARLPHFRLEFTPSSGDEQQSEYLVAHEHGADAVRAVHDLDLAGVVQVVEFRTIAADELWLSPCHDRATFGLHFTWVDDDVAVHAAVAALERALAPFDARPHWGKVFLAEPSSVRAHYPRLADFQALAARHDPNRKFGNDFLERFVY
jgi:xylitol oxidase